VSGVRVIAAMLQPVEAETPYGGRAVSYEPLGTVWLAPGLERRRERSETGAARILEAMTAEARSDPRLAEGRVLRFGGADWSIVALQADPERPGRTVLSLERER